MADLALNLIEIIDRNLYERSCDVRWWATDAAVVGCAAGGVAAADAAARLGVILDAYTVYLDIWICAPDGRVLANGRPQRFQGAALATVADQAWFREALAGPEQGFAVADIAPSPALDGQLVATYAAPIRAGGAADGPAIGVIGIFFDWGRQAQLVVDGVRLEAAARRVTRCLIIDAGRRVLAASDRQGVLAERIDLAEGCPALGHALRPGQVIAWARTPGYETYRGLGWYGVLIRTDAAELVAG